MLFRSNVEKYLEGNWIFQGNTSNWWIDKGLAGAYNANIIKTYLHELHQDDQSGITNKTIAIGRKIAQAATRIKDTEIVGTYEDLPDRVPGAQFHAILNTAKDMFEAGTVDAVDVIFTRFVSSMTQKADIVFSPPTMTSPTSAAIAMPLYR